MGEKTWELYFTHSWVGNALANPENSKNQEKRIPTFGLYLKGYYLPKS
jgi:hypothetical protein